MPNVAGGRNWPEVVFPVRASIDPAPTPIFPGTNPSPGISMPFVTIRDDSLWASHIDGGAGLPNAQAEALIATIMQNQ